LQINDIKFTIEKLREFYIWRQGIDGATLTTEVNKKLAEILEILCEHGEKPEYWADYLTFTKETVTSNFNSHRQWVEYFKSISKESFEHSDNKANSESIVIAQSYLESVETPLAAFFELSEQSELLWLHSSQYKSEFDNYLWQTHYSEFNMSPVASQWYRYEFWQYRSWWQVKNPSVSNGVKEDMYQGLVNLGSSNSEPWSWQDTHPIAIAFGVTS